MLFLLSLFWLTLLLFLPMLLLLLLLLLQQQLMMMLWLLLMLLFCCYWYWCLFVALVVVVVAVIFFSLVSVFCFCFCYDCCCSSSLVCRSATLRIAECNEWKTRVVPAQYRDISPGSTYISQRLTTNKPSGTQKWNRSHFHQHYSRVNFLRPRSDM
jgi:hypothetical protein